MLMYEHLQVFNCKKVLKPDRFDKQFYCLVTSAYTVASVTSIEVGDVAI